jgi:antitoxin CptB
MDQDLTLETIRKRTLYRACHRGTKELDWLLGHYVTEKADHLSQEELLHLDALMANPDPLIENWIMGRVEVVDEGFKELVHSIRAFHKL